MLFFIKFAFQNIDMYTNQHTLKHKYEFEGKGLHTGCKVNMSIEPAPPNHGIKFRRSDLGEGAPLVEACIDYVSDTSRSTTLDKDGVTIITLEHLMGALYAMNIDNALITLNAPEVPILDGSAKFYAEAFAKDGLVEQNAPRQYLVLDEKVVCRNEKGSELAVLPDDHFSVDVTIDFNSKVMGTQSAHYEVDTDFVTEIAPCRTFVFFHELEPLLKNNLIKGGDLDNALVIVENPVPQQELDRLAGLFNTKRLERVPEGYLSHTSLRFQNECARHKLLDVLGDLSLVGYPIKGKVIANKSGHSINTKIARELRALAVKQLSK